MNGVMMDINVLMSDFLQKLNETFANRVWFVGLQGSYSHGEATEISVQQKNLYLL